MLPIFKNKNKSVFTIIIIFGILIRFLIIWLPGFQIDINDFFAWSLRLTELGVSKFYDPHVFTDYTPGYLYILLMLGIVHNLFFLPAQFFFIILKIPAILFDIGLAILIFKILALKSNQTMALIGASVIIFNPGIIFESSIWGQIDVILTFFLLLSIYFLEKENLILASAYFAVAILIKPQAIALIPLYGLFIIKSFIYKKSLTTRNLLELILPGVGVVFLFSLPFFPHQPFTGFITKFFGTANEYQYTSLFAYNLWGIFHFWQSDQLRFMSLTWETWGILLLLIFWLICSYFYIKRHLSLYALATLGLLAFYFLPTRVHDRYLYPALPFLIIIALLGKSKILQFATIALNLTFFLNLYYVYIFYNVFYFHTSSFILNQALYKFLNNNGKFMSLLSSFLFATITIIILHNKHVQKSIQK